VQLRPALGPARHEAHERLADLDVPADALAVEHVRKGLGLRLRVIGLQVEFREAQTVTLLEQIVDPVARRMELEPVAGVRRHERAAPAVLLHAQVGIFGTCDRALELVVVERQPDMVDAWHCPLSRLYHDVDRAELELRQAQLEPERVELHPRHPRLVRRQVLPDAAVARDQLEAELADVARFDLAHLARHEVVVEEVHGSMVGGFAHALSNLRWFVGVHHVDLVVSSIERSLPFYRELLGPLGWHRLSEVEGERGETIWYIGGAETSIGLRQAQSESGDYDRYTLGLHHLAFDAYSRAVVDERAQWLRDNGTLLESEPQEYTYSPGYYAVFFYDPDGLKLEILHTPAHAA
jgi:glyoxylase I family protein